MQTYTRSWRVVPLAIALALAFVAAITEVACPTRTMIQHGVLVVIP